MKRILLDASPYLRRAALIDGRDMVELVYDRPQAPGIVGNVYMARVENVLPGMKAAFLNMGGEKNAYYYYGSKDAETENKQKPHNGQELLVQVVKPGTGAKGPVVSTKLSFPGKFLVLLPDEPETVGVSRKIEDVAERERIRSLLARLLPQGVGAVVRTDGEGRSEEEFRAEIDRLWKSVQAVRKVAGFRKAPALLYRELNPLLKAVRDLWGQDVEEIIVNDKALFDELEALREHYGRPAGSVKLYDKPTPLFEEFFVEKEAQKAFQKRVWLKSGGFLVIDQTEACVVIDVNTGKFTGKKDPKATFLKTNLEAAAEIARQLRLRNLSGLIIVDFIDLQTEADKETLREALIEAVRGDRVKTLVVGMTELGLMQLTRKKTGPSLWQSVGRPCVHCGGLGLEPSREQLAMQIYRECKALLAQTVFDEVTVTASPALLAVLSGPEGKTVERVQQELGGRIVLNPGGSDDRCYTVKGRKTPKDS